MREFAGKTAFVTGGAAGIGLALGRAFARSGMKVMLADIETDALQAAVKSLQEISPDIRGTICDVADAESVERAAQASFDAFGRVHVVCNNAGVAAGGGIDHISLDNWRWVIDVNLMGVLHGIKSFLPHIRAHGEGGHIVNTASMAGMQTGLGFSPYGASKFAVVGMSEGLCHQLKPLGIGVSVLCPASSAPASAKAGATGPPVTASHRRSIPPVRRRRWWPKSPGRSAPGSIPTRSLRACSRRSWTTSSIFSPIPACGPRSRRVSTPFWPLWTGFNPHNPAHPRP